MSEIEKLNMIAEWQEQHKQLIEDLNNSKKRIADLEKENAELKNKVEMSNKVYNDNLDYSHHIEGQLTKAKEIISEYVRLANLEKEDTVAIWQLYHKAEQFLNCSEKPNN